MQGETAMRSDPSPWTAPGPHCGSTWCASASLLVPLLPDGSAAAGRVLQGQEERANTAGLEAYLELLEDVTPSHADLVNWELWVLRQNGYDFQLWPCMESGLQADGFSLAFGGAISTARIRANDTFVCPGAALKAASEMSTGEFSGAGDEVHGGVRGLLNHIWNGVLERPLKSAVFIGPGSFCAAREGTKSKDFVYSGNNLRQFKRRR